MKLRTLLVLAALVLAASAACKSKTPAAAAPATSSDAAKSGPPGAAPAPVKPVPPQLPEVLAKVNGEVIGRAEFELAVRTLEARAQSAVPVEQRDQVYRQVLDRIVGYKLLLQESKARKIAPSDADVESRLQQMKTQFPNEDAFKKALSDRGITVEKLRQETGETIAVNQLLEKEIEPQVKVEDKDISDFYAKNKQEFKQAEGVRASHILIRLPEKADAAARAKAKAQADQALKQLAGGAKFDELAKKVSQDPGSAANGGDLGFFSKGQMVPAFENAAFALKPGQTSGVVETPFGYHIIRVAETRAARELPLDEVKDQIKNYLTDQMRSAKSEAFVQGLRAKAKVEILI
jgi:peptidyl-prolyl cis-trans isomerase C